MTDNDFLLHSVFLMQLTAKSMQHPASCLFVEVSAHMGFAAAAQLLDTSSLLLSPDGC